MLYCSAVHPQGAPVACSAVLPHRVDVGAAAAAQYKQLQERRRVPLALVFSDAQRVLHYVKITCCHDFGSTIVPHEASIAVFVLAT